MGRTRDFTQSNVDEILRIIDEEVGSDFVNTLGQDWTDTIFAQETGVPKIIQDLIKYFFGVRDKRALAREKFIQILKDVRFVDQHYKKIFQADGEAMEALAEKIVRLSAGFSPDVLNKPPYTYDANGKPVTNGDDFYSWIVPILTDYEEKRTKAQNEINQALLEVCLNKYAFVSEDGHITGVRTDKILAALQDPSSLNADAAVALHVFWDYIKFNEEAAEAGLIRQIAPFLAVFSFEYDEVNHFYETNNIGFQSYVGFTNAYEDKKIQAAMGMDLYWEVIPDIPLGDGKTMDLRLWRGQYGYGSNIGAEMGIYMDYPTPSADPTRAGVDRAMGLFTGLGAIFGLDSGDYKPTARPEDQVQMTAKIYDADTGQLLTYNDNNGQAHFWNLTMDSNIYQQRSGEFGTDAEPYTKDNIKVEYSIVDPTFDPAAYERQTKNGTMYISPLEQGLNDLPEDRKMEDIHTEIRQTASGEWESVVYFTWAAEGHP
ncbi:MAG: DUF4474 domain-containing protein [Clostridiales Family XIII bacterium]|jgi:hypothetical protein|nr:DUF4474 domain-containing protein [Clostridiales Family XIII bacterium]